MIDPFCDTAIKLLQRHRQHLLDQGRYEELRDFSQAVACLFEDCRSSLWEADVRQHP